MARKPITINLHKIIERNTKLGFVVYGLREAVQRGQPLGEAADELWNTCNSDPPLRFERGAKFESRDEFDISYVRWACRPVYESSAKPSDDGYYVAGYEDQIDNW